MVPQASFGRTQRIRAATKTDPNPTLHFQGEGVKSLLSENSLSPLSKGSSGKGGESERGSIDRYAG